MTKTAIRGTHERLNRMIAPKSSHASAIRGVIHCYLLRPRGSSLPANPASDRP
jgi:hypothetical protein